MSVRARDVHSKQCIEALRRAKFKFPGRQKVSDLAYGFSSVAKLSNELLCLPRYSDSSFQEVGYDEMDKRGVRPGGMLSLSPLAVCRNPIVV